MADTWSVKPSRFEGRNNIKQTKQTNNTNNTNNTNKTTQTNNTNKQNNTNNQTQTTKQQTNNTNKQHKQTTQTNNTNKQHKQTTQTNNTMTTSDVASLTTTFITEGFRVVKGDIVLKQHYSLNKQLVPQYSFFPRQPTPLNLFEAMIPMPVWQLGAEDHWNNEIGCVDREGFNKTWDWTLQASYSSGSNESIFDLPLFST